MTVCHFSAGTNDDNSGERWEEGPSKMSEEGMFWRRGSGATHRGALGNILVLFMLPKMVKCYVKT